MKPSAIRIARDNSMRGKLALRGANESAAVLIVLGARGLAAVQRFLLGSVSEAVLRDARCAVLIATRPRR